MGNGSFSTLDFINRFSRMFPTSWEVMIKEYGQRGKGTSKYYSANTHIAHVLGHLFNAGQLDKLDYRPAPNEWGNRIIRYWSMGNINAGDTIYPDEATVEYDEGEKSVVSVNRYERSPVARQKCIEAHGIKCKGCGIDFEEIYGERGAGFIHVHHVVSVASKSGPYKVDPVKDLIPVCPNCHAMIHRRTPYLSLEKLRELLE